MRWGESVKSLTVAYTNIDGDTLVSAGIISYASPFTPDYRKNIVKDWQNQLVDLKIPHSSGASTCSTASLFERSDCSLPSYRMRLPRRMRILQPTRTKPVRTRHPATRPT